VTDLDTTPWDNATTNLDQAIQHIGEATLRFYAVDGRGRVNLAGLVEPGAQFYRADKAPNGVITLTPVEIVTTAVKRTAE